MLYSVYMVMNTDKVSGVNGVLLIVGDMKAIASLGSFTKEQQQVILEELEKHGASFMQYERKGLIQVMIEPYKGPMEHTGRWTYLVSTTGDPNYD